jgi:hypothetical protein
MGQKSVIQGISVLESDPLLYAPPGKKEISSSNPWGNGSGRMGMIERIP